MHSLVNTRFVRLARAAREIEARASSVVNSETVTIAVVAYQICLRPTSEREMMLLRGVIGDLVRADGGSYVLHAHCQRQNCRVLSKDSV